MRSVLLVLLALLSITAFAARLATVEADHVEVKDDHTDTAEVIETVPHGSKMAASNQATEGFHKVRTPSGKIGWVEAGQLKLGQTPTKAAPAAAAASPATAPAAAPPATAPVDNPDQLLEP